MNVFILLGFAVIVFAIITFTRKINDDFVLITGGIGALVNAFYWVPFTVYDLPMNQPILIGDLVLGMDSILFTAFFYMTMLRAFDYSIKAAKSLTITSVVAVIIAAIIEYVAVTAHNGSFSIGDFQKLMLYVASCAGVLAGVWISVFITKIMKEKKINAYLIIAVGIILCSIIHSIIFMGGYMLIYQTTIANFLNVILGTYLTKGICLILALIGYAINRKQGVSKHE